MKNRNLALTRAKREKNLSKKISTEVILRKNWKMEMVVKRKKRKNSKKVTLKMRNERTTRNLTKFRRFTNIKWTTNVVEDAIKTFQTLNRHKTDHL